MGKAASERLIRVAIYAVLILGPIVMFAPFLFLISSSLKVETQVFEYPIRWIPDPVRWMNYVESLTYKPFHIYFKNTITAIRIKSKIGRGGVIEDIWFKDIIVTGLSQRPAFWLDALYASHTVQPATDTLTTFRDIHVENLASWGSERSVEIGAYAAQPAENITVKNVFVTADNGLLVENADGVVFEDVNIIPHSERGEDLEPLMRIINGRDITITGSRPFHGTRTFLRVEGESSGDIRLIDNDLSLAETPVELADGVARGAVTITDEKN